MTDNISRPLARRSFLKTTTAGAAATALAGCRGSGDSIGDSLKIGVLAPGPDGTSPVGTSMANGAKLAVEQLNDDDGVLDADVEVIVKDTQASTSTGRQAYQELTLGEEVNATFGTFTSEVLMALMDSIAEQQTIHLSTGAATPDSSARLRSNYEKYKYYFRAGPLNAVQIGQSLQNLAENMFQDIGWNRVALVAESYEWTQPVMDTLSENLPPNGIEVVKETRYATGTTNFGPIYDDIESTDADAMVTAMAHPGGSVPAIVQWARGRRNFGLGGVHIPSQLPSFWESSRGTAAYTVGLNVATPESEITEKTQPFIQDYQQRFDDLPVYTGYLTYDAVKLFASVLEEIGTANPDDVVSAMEETTYTGTVGTLRFNGPDTRFPHDIPYGPEFDYPIYQQWQPAESGNGGTQQVIFPDEFSTADYQQPPWLQ
jgi:branched-chain amino acid transport system substrate-binding protein